MYIADGGLRMNPAEFSQLYLKGSNVSLNSGFQPLLLLFACKQKWFEFDLCHSPLFLWSPMRKPQWLCSRAIMQSAVPALNHIQEVEGWLAAPTIWDAWTPGSKIIISSELLIVLDPPWVLFKLTVNLSYYTSSKHLTRVQLLMGIIYALILFQLTVMETRQE